MIKVKYIITKEGKILVFNEWFQHSEFKHFEPISAGFISFGVNQNRNPTCCCYGESISLGLKSRE